MNKEVTPETVDDLEPDVVLAWAREHLAGYKRPKGVEIWPELPKSAANKILRRKVREIITERDTSTEREA